jgi:SAM-dependent methyltransferase
MPKAGELAYLRMIGLDGVRHAANKPFSDPGCGRYLVALGLIRMLLPPPPARLFDLGCGPGWTSWFFAKMGYDVVGQDIAPDMIYHARVNQRRYQVENAMFVVGDYEEIRYSEEFDCAVFFDSLHHAEDERLALEKTCRALKPGGVCVTHEPGEGHAESEASQMAVQRYGVTEKDMPPYRIIAIAKEVGFRDAVTYPLLDVLLEQVLRDPKHWGPCLEMASLAERRGGFVVLQK